MKVSKTGANGFRYSFERGRTFECEEFCNMAWSICDSLKKFYPLPVFIPHEGSPTEKEIDSTIAEIYYNRGNVAAETNRPEDAFENHSMFNSMMMKQLGNGPQGTDMRLGISLNELGIAHMLRNDYCKGEDCFLQSIDTMQRLDNYVSHQISLPMVNLGLTYWLTDRHEEAVKVLEQGLSDREAAFGINDRESFM